MYNYLVRLVTLAHYRWYFMFLYIWKQNKMKRLKVKFK